MKLKLNLTHKALMMVSGLLIFELALLTILAYLLVQSQHQADIEANSKSIIIDAAYLSKTYQDAGAAIFQFGLTRKKQHDKTYQKLISEIKPRIESIRSRIGGNQDQVTAINRIEKLGDELINRYEEGRKTIAHGSGAAWDRLRLVVNTQKSGEIITELTATLEDFIVAEEKKVRALPITEKEYRSRLNTFLIIAVAVNIILAITLAIGLIKGITQRLQIVVDNTKRLAREESLNEPIKGEDEIVSLDSAFHQMAEALAESTRKEREMLDKVSSMIKNLPVGLVTVNQQGQIESANPKAEEIFQCEESQLVNKPLSLLFSEDNGKSDAEFMKHVLEKAQGTVCEFSGSKLSGAGFPMEVSVKEESGSRGKSYLVNILDVTERHEVERLKREFVAMVSHDLRSPLTAIKGVLSVLSKARNLADKQRDRVTAAEVEATRLMTLVTDLLDVARMESGRFKIQRHETSLAAIIDRAVASTLPLSDQKGITIEADETDIEMYADEDRLIQVLVNLLSNAVKFSESDSKIRIAVKDLEDAVEVRVSDSGCGIPESYREAIFERFQQVDSAGQTEQKGTGLGLAICRAIIEEHDGSIGVDSELGKGSTFWFRLPFSE